MKKVTDVFVASLAGPIPLELRKTSKLARKYVTKNKFPEVPKLRKGGWTPPPLRELKFFHWRYPSDKNGFKKGNTLLYILFTFMLKGSREFFFFLNGSATVPLSGGRG